MDTNYAVAPGEYLAEWLEEERLTQQQLGMRLGWSRKRVNEVVGGRAPVNAEAAIELQRVTGIPADSWMRFEIAYRGDLARLHDSKSLEEDADLIQGPLATYLRKLGATRATRRNPAQLVSDFLTFHRCGTTDAYRETVADHFRGEFQLATLKDSSTAVEPGLLMAWLRAGELTEAYEKAGTKTYSGTALRALLPELRERAANPDPCMTEDLAALLDVAGVTLQMVTPPSPFPLHGVTRWVENRAPIIQQTGRRSTDGFIVWTLFHELGHILNDPRGETHFEFTSEQKRNTQAERSANEFAMSTLFGETGMQPFQGLERDSDIAQAAWEVGVSPGVAVLQMRRRRLLSYTQGHRLCVNL